MLRSGEDTSVIQSIHHQHELSEELHIVVGAIGKNMKSQIMFQVSSKSKAQIQLQKASERDKKQKLTSLHCHGRQRYLQWGRTARRFP